MTDTFITFVSSDNIQVRFSFGAAVKNGIVANLFTNGQAFANIHYVPIPYVPFKTLALVCEFCEHHKNTVVPAEPDISAAGLRESAIWDQSSFNTAVNTVIVRDISPWEQQWVARLERTEVYSLICAATYLDNTLLYSLMCQVLADLIGSCQSTEEMREKFYIKNDLSDSQLEMIERENQHVLFPW